MIYLILAAFVISMVMESPIAFFSRRMKRGFAIVISYLIVLLFLFIISVIVLPFIVSQLAEVINMAL